MNELKPLPYLIPEVKADINGRIFKNNEEITLIEFNSEYGLNVNDAFVLTLIAFHSLLAKPNLWNELIVIGNKQPRTINNSILTFNKPVPCELNDGFYHIPYFSEYVVNKEGKMIKLSTGQEIKSSLHSQGYYTYGLRHDTGKRTNYLLHRILAMTFFKPVDIFSKLEVNHINSVRGDDRLENLEWVYRSGNVRHAYDNKRRTDNKEIQARDTSTGNVYIFTTCTRAAVFFDVSVWSVIHSANSKGFKSVNGIQYRYHPDFTDWPEPNVYGGYTVLHSDGRKETVDIRELAKRVNSTLEKLSRKLRRKDFKFNNFIVEPIVVPRDVSHVE